MSGAAAATCRFGRVSNGTRRSEALKLGDLEERARGTEAQPWEGGRAPATPTSSGIAAKGRPLLPAPCWQSPMWTPGGSHGGRGLTRGSPPGLETRSVNTDF